MKKYLDINELDARIEKEVKKTVKYYYTDWKNYDRPAYMNYKSSTRPADKKLLLMLRDTGSYLYKLEGIKNNVVFNYFKKYEPDVHNYYIIDLNKLTFSQVPLENIS